MSEFHRHVAYRSKTPLMLLNEYAAKIRGKVCVWGGPYGGGICVSHASVAAPSRWVGGLMGEDRDSALGRVGGGER